MAWAMDLTGATCGRYEVWGPIGEGGMSRVWLARHKHLAVPVILKTLRDFATQGGTGTSDDAGAPGTPFARLRNEARMMARIPSARVVRAVDVGMHEGCPYLVQEYIDGLDLAELDAVRRRALRRGLPLWFVCLVTSDVADALHAAHLTGVLHRDVKPSNLLYSPQVGLRLGDFGIAVTRDARDGLGAGTLRFLAPEALRGAVPTRRADIYSLGATAFDLLYGTPPFPELADILGEKPLHFPDARSAEEAYFQHVLAKMLRRRPEDRSHSARASERLLGSLARALKPKLPAVALGRGQYLIDKVRVSCVLGDIAEAEADGIVNSANDQLEMRSGVGDALRRRGGDVIEKEITAAARAPSATASRAVRARSAARPSCTRSAAGARSRASRARRSAPSSSRRSSASARSRSPRSAPAWRRSRPEASAYAVASALKLHLLLGGSRLEEVRFVLFDSVTYDLFVEQVTGVFLGEEDTSEEQEVATELTTALEATVRFDMTTDRKG
jgi:serine/threonine protein kinase